MKRSVLAAMAVSIFAVAVAACQPAEEPAADQEMPMTEEVPEGEEQQPPAMPTDTGTADTMDGMEPEGML
ncbi:MAG: hypothetical protein ACODAE_08795 [Gemmatimonadota bacterium]